MKKDESLTMIKLAVWLILFICLLSVGLNLVSAPNTAANILGIAVILANLILTIKTKCLTTINFRKHEK